MQNLDQTYPRRGSVFTPAGRNAFLIAPDERAAGAPWVWYAPTLPIYPGDAEEWMFERFLAAGIAIAGIDAGESYGSPAGTAIFSALYDEMRRRGFASRPCLLARSRGGLMLYNWAVENPSRVACVAGIYPVCDLRSYPGIERACGAYLMSEAELTAKLSDHNPIDRIEPLAKAGVPLFHIHGDIDELVPLEANSGALIQRHREFGGEATLVVPEGQGHNLWPGFFQCRELVDFVIANAK